tara:strand:+ start:412 stop:2376 length:1965 start_codon:yes stop_codon:yes gene_type:complete
MNTLNYRPDIDGLRTLAVLPVILYHAGAHWLPGGFVGVDIFFVISGYLICSIILRESHAGEFSFIRFYERRLRRIIPALLLVLLSTVIVFQVIALPDQAQDAAESGISALLSVSNFYFWRHSGYFAPSSDFLPLLHTWSLAVEEQFYLLFPVVVLLVLKFRLPIKWVFVAGVIANFAFGYWLSLAKPSVAYYLLPARAWELGIGAILAAGAIPPIKGSLLRELVPALGIGLIVFSMVFIHSGMTFPGWVALMPCLGTAMVIHAGGQSWAAQRLLAARPVVFVGLLSYSLYLWHWPVLVALRIRTATAHLDLPLAALGIVMTFLLAWLSWRYVEMPFRNRREMPGRTMLVRLTQGAAALVLVCGVAIATNGFSMKLDQAARVALAASKDIDPLRDMCRNVADRSQCKFGPKEVPVTYAVIGDSHAATIRPAIAASGLMGDAAGTLFWYGSCPFLDGAEMEHQPSDCADFKADVWAFLQDHPDLETVILAGRLAKVVTGIIPENAGAYPEFFTDAQTVTPSVAENARVFKRAYARTLGRLESLGLNVILLGSLPEPGFDVPRTMALARYNGFQPPQGVRVSEVAERAGRVDAMLSLIAGQHPGVRFIPVWESFCSGQWCQTQQNGVPLYCDDDHLSFRAAATIVAPAIAAAVRAGR